MADEAKSTETGAAWAKSQGLVAVVVYLTADERELVRAAAKGSEQGKAAPWCRSVLVGAARRAAKKAAEKSEENS